MQKDSPQVIETALPGVLLLTPPLYSDARGFFSEIYNEETFASLGITTSFIQDSVSFSVKNVIRGMHYQTAPFQQAKLVRCASGRIYDVIADIDPTSPTYGTYVGVELSGDMQQMVYIPGQYAHGFGVLSDGAHVAYKLSGEQNPLYAGGVMYNDPVLHIAWPIQNPVLSEKDRGWAPLS